LTTTLEEDKRLTDILDMIGRVASLDFSQTLHISSENDMVDAIALGLNMLSEELNLNVVEKSKLDTVNAKLEKFAYTTAHDLRSPLNSIFGLVTLLELSLNPEPDSDITIYISKLKKTILQMKSLLQGILEYSKVDISQVPSECVDLNLLIKEIIEIDEISTVADVTILNTLPNVSFNKPAIYQVFQNLLNNAVKYSDKDRCKIEIEVKEQSMHYQISISDNGPGIAEPDQERIFELFNKTGNTANSHGIGLSTVKNILSSVGQRIWVESILGNGATFKFTLKRL
jgi:signal transduction histidine kinase